MRLHNVTYLFKEGSKNVFSNKLMSFACIGVLIACFLLIGSAVLLALTVSNMVQYMEDQNEFVAFLEDGTTQDDISAIQLKLQNLDNVSMVRFVSKDEALESEKLLAGDDASLWDGLEGENNPYPDTYVIRVDDLSMLHDTAAKVRVITGIEKTNTASEVAEILESVKNVVYVAGAGIVLILIAVSIVIITNTIKLTVFSRRKEINIMKYVGATDSFIRLPFLVEGMLIGLIAAVLAFLILGGAYTYLLQWANENYSDLIAIVLNNAVVYREIALMMLAAFAALGILIGMMGSGLFVRKYLKV